MPGATTSFTNPSTETAYRLVVTGASWRITKARDDHGRMRLAHLRGEVGAGKSDAAAVARFVAGTGGEVNGETDPGLVFAAVVLLDMERTADVLTAMAREAQSVYDFGCKGFRPRSSILREQRDRALAQAVAECRSMAQAWRESGLIASRPLPGWLAAGLEDGIQWDLEGPKNGA